MEPQINKEDADASVTSNINLEQIHEIKQYITSPYGASLVALTSIDPKYLRLEMNIIFVHSTDLKRFTENLIEIWEKYEPFPSEIRNYTNKGDDKSHITTPSSLEEYGTKKALIDVEADKESDTYKFIIYRWSEPGPRIISCSTKQLNDNMLIEQIFRDSLNEQVSKSK